MSAPLTDAALRRLIRTALREDVGKGDVTTIACISERAKGTGILVSKAEGVLCGLAVAAHVFAEVDPKVRIMSSLRDGASLLRGTHIAQIRGNLRALLTAERTALNFLQHLSGVSTRTDAFVRAVQDTDAVILDTRKTTPMLRVLQKYAVRVGGGMNHRSRLDDMVLIKDNHIAAAGSIAGAVAKCRKNPASRNVPIEVETTSITQVMEVLELDGVDRIMLDNYTLAQIRAAVKLVAHRIPLEVSGGVTLDTVRAIAETGVEFISVGALTHSAPALDIAFNIE